MVQTISNLNVSLAMKVSIISKDKSAIQNLRQSASICGLPLFLICLRRYRLFLRGALDINLAKLLGTDCRFEHLRKLIATMPISCQIGFVRFESRGIDESNPNGIHIQMIADK